MAHLDSETGSLNLQIVYDGAPRSGKTSSMVTLGRLFDCPVITPEEDQGRTVYFDWMDYSGGLCRGRPIQCRTIAVPGQEKWAGRRQLIVKSADVVLFVVDSSARHFAKTRECFEELQALIGSRKREIPILLQVNKRDTEDALPIETVLEALDPTLQKVETVAIASVGVREAFVLAVGAAVRGLRDSGILYDGGLFDTQELQLPSPDQLVELLESA